MERTELSFLEGQWRLQTRHLPEQFYYTFVWVSFKSMLQIRKEDNALYLFSQYQLLWLDIEKWNMMIHTLPMGYNIYGI